MYIQLPTPDKKCSKCGAINQTEQVRRDKGFGRTSVLIRCAKCGHEKVEAEESVYPIENTGYTQYNYNNDEHKIIEF